MRDFPHALTRQVRAVALLEGVTINRMLASLVEAGLKQKVTRLYVDQLAGAGLEAGPPSDPATPSADPSVPTAPPAIRSEDDAVPPVVYHEEAEP